MVYAVSTFSLQEMPTKGKLVSEFTNGWVQIKDGGQQVVPNLPAPLNCENNTVVIQRTLPTGFDCDTVLGIRVIYQRLAVYIDGEKIYDAGKNDTSPFGYSYGYVWYFIPIKSSYSGKLITLEYSSSLNISKMNIDSVILGSVGAAYLNIINHNISLIFLCFLMLVISLSFFIISLIIHYQYPNVRLQSNIYFGLFLLITTIWLITDSDILQFFIQGRAFFFLFCFYSFMLLPVPFLLFMNELCERKYRILRVMCCLFAVNTVVCNILYVFRIRDLIETVPSTHVLMVSSLIIITVISVLEIKKENTEIRDIIVGIALLVVCSFISLIQFYASNMEYSLFFRLGILFFGIFMGVSAFKKVITLINASISVSTYKMLAYTDSMTGLGNRASFSETVDLIQNKKMSYSSVALLVFDIDNLKPVNDALGHMSGDRLIRRASDYISSAFTGFGRCYRTGGDEFAVISTNKSKRELHERLTRLQKLICDYNSDNCDGNSLSLSIGYDFREADELKEISVSDIYNLADAKMYEDKSKKVREIKR
jgi:diguanylate cyclase (GGDEF) domain